MFHLSHPNNEVAIQVLGFLQAILYFGNKSAQAKIEYLCRQRGSTLLYEIYRLLGISGSILCYKDNRKVAVHRLPSASSIALVSILYYSK